MVERFNGRISEIVRQTRFASAAQLEATLMNYVKIYNHHIPQRALKHVSPVQALKDWYVKKPELFKKRVYKQAGLDNCRIPCDHILRRSWAFFQAREVMRDVVESFKREQST